MSTDYFHFFYKLLIHIFCQFFTRLLSNVYGFIDATIDGTLRSFKFVCGRNMSNLLFLDLECFILWRKAFLPKIINFSSIFSGSLIVLIFMFKFLIYLELMFYARQELNFIIFQSDSHLSPYHLLHILSVLPCFEMLSYLYMTIWKYDIYIPYVLYTYA